jgi:hypothetical protein
METLGFWTCMWIAGSIGAVAGFFACAALVVGREADRR